MSEDKISRSGNWRGNNTRGRGNRGRGRGQGRGGYKSFNTSWKPKDGQESIDESKKIERAARFGESNKFGAEEYGFVSRGEDDRLQRSSKEREKFFDKIIRKFIAYCESNDTSTLSKELKRFTEDHQSDEKIKNVTMDSILSSLRKLRESMINGKCDKFTVKVFLFSIRISANIGHYQTYLPSIHFLLQQQDQELLQKPEKREIVTLLILHLSHFSKNNLKAFKEYFEYFKDEEDPTLLRTLKSWSTKDCFNWIRLYNNENDSAKSTIMRFGINAIIERMIQTINVSYFHLDLDYLNRSLPNGITFDNLQKNHNVTWKVEGKNLIIRERKVK
ncbi:hypothetical protein CLIB1444_08S05688 [[Candida] jaroonii]|uniref:Uncharacterized protein n=1 Tax=[Candida] jaroonii TaxID=467808 RepID=A0ACA9YBQ7_9ASCO|nr:hypothetical protein CLIB1444_08S05688 [[Candida] jaroonii]